jgi:hypothetical protein
MQNGGNPASRASPFPSWDSRSGSWAWEIRPVHWPKPDNPEAGLRPCLGVVSRRKRIPGKVQRGGGERSQRALGGLTEGKAKP